MVVAMMLSAPPRPERGDNTILNATTDKSKPNHWEIHTTMGQWKTQDMCANICKSISHQNFAPITC